MNPSSAPPLCYHGLTFIPALMINYIHYKVWGEITYSFPNFKGCTVEVWEWISNFKPHFTGHVITYPCQEGPLESCALQSYMMSCFMQNFEQIYNNHDIRELTYCHLCRHSWLRHQMETFSALLDICARNSPVTGEFPAQRPGTRSFDVFFDLHLNNRLSNNREAGDLRR